SRGEGREIPRPESARRHRARAERDGGTPFCRVSGGIDRESQRLHRQEVGLRLSQWSLENAILQRRHDGPGTDRRGRLSEGPGARRGAGLRTAPSLAPCAAWPRPGPSPPPPASLTPRPAPTIPPTL